MGEGTTEVHEGLPGCSGKTIQASGGNHIFVGSSPYNGGGEPVRASLVEAVVPKDTTTVTRSKGAVAFGAFVGVVMAVLGVFGFEYVATLYPKMTVFEKIFVEPIANGEHTLHLGVNTTDSPKCYRLRVDALIKGRIDPNRTSVPTIAGDNANYRPLGVALNGGGMGRSGQFEITYHLPADVTGEWTLSARHLYMCPLLGFLVSLEPRQYPFEYINIRK